MTDVLNKLAAAIRGGDQREIAKIIVESDITACSELAIFGFLITKSNILNHMDAAKKLAGFEYHDFRSDIRAGLIQEYIDDIASGDNAKKNY